MKRSLFAVGLATAGLWLTSCATAPEPSTVVVTPRQIAKEKKHTGSVVTIENTDNGYQLLFNGKPYFVKGAGAKEYLFELVDAGANSIRTWGTEMDFPLLNKARAHRLTVTAGIWMGHERHGFDYSDKQAVQEQLDKARALVEKHKNHPALLMWSVGNEAEWFPGDNTAVYKAINDVAKMIKEVDPYHPVMTIIAELGEDHLKVAHVKEHCPDIDVLGINSYGGARSVPDRLREAGWKKPYMLTEFGPLGPWEVGKTIWDAEIERTSTTKADFYLESYNEGVLSQPGWCLGSYVFLWGHKQEVTHTWFNMFTKRGERLNPIDTMTYAWSGKWPTNRCPMIREIQCPIAEREVPPGTEYEAVVLATDPDGDSISFKFEMYQESSDKKEGGDKESKPTDQSAFVIREAGNLLRLKTPSEPGAYRLFAYAYDGFGNASVANIPFFVDAALGQAMQAQSDEDGSEEL